MVPPQLAHISPGDSRPPVRSSLPAAQTKARPIFDEFEIWPKDQLPKISRKTKLAEAIRYALSRMPKAYLETAAWSWTITTASARSDR